MDVPERLSMNPALMPSKGYFKIPVLSIGGEYTANALTIQDLMDVTDDEKPIDDKEGFLQHLENNNKVQANMALDILSFGFYTGKHFWSLHLGVRAKGRTLLPRQLFEFANDLNDTESIGNYDIPKTNLSYQAYLEAGLGYGIQLTDKLSLGIRANVLFGVMQSKLTMSGMQIIRQGDNVRIAPQNAEVTVSPSFYGGDYNEDDYITDYPEGDYFYFDDMLPSHFAISGFGMGFDLGASYRLLDNLTVSAALNDLGFLNWNNTVKGKGVENEINVNELKYSVIDSDIFSFASEGEKNVNRSICPQLNIGAEYGFLENKLGVGILSSTRFDKPFSTTELTLSGNYRPNSNFGATLSYSMVQSQFKTIGIGIKLGSLFIGSDYLFFKSPKQSGNLGGYIGLSIPLGKSRNI
ncbi:DUF5723 family protein [Parabacteroides sp.]